MRKFFEGICNLLAEENTVISLEIKKELYEFILGKNFNFCSNKITSNVSSEVALLLKTSKHFLAKEIIEAEKWLQWRKTTIPSSLIAEEVSNLFYVCPIIGIDTFTSSEKFRLGLLYQKPNSYYPLHNHNAVETYVVIGGELDWTDGIEKRKLNVGDVIHHPSLIPHAFTTGQSGFLGLWHWSGDISPESYKVLE